MEHESKLNGLAGLEQQCEEPRLPIDQEATLTLLKRRERIACSVVALCLAGCDVQTAGQFPAEANEQVEIAIQLCGLGFRFQGSVEAALDGRSSRIRFTDLSQRRFDELVEAMCELAAAQAVNAVRRAARRAAKARSQMQPEGTCQPQAKEPSPPAAPAQTPAIEPGALRSRDVRDRRFDPRKDVDTTATILLVNVASRLPGRILNLSLGGCRIYTDARFPVGIYTRVEVEFHLEGLPFRMGGVVQRLNDQRFVAVRFLDVSQRKREQLTQLIAEIEESGQIGEQAEAKSPF